MPARTVITCIVVFFIVLVPYLLLQIILSSKPTVKISEEGRNLPPLFRLIWKAVVYLAEPMTGIERSIPLQFRIKMKNLLVVSDILMELNQLIAASVILSVGFVVFIVLFLVCFTADIGVLFVGGVIVGVLGAVYPVMTVYDLARKRQQKIVKALPFALDMISSAVRSGIDITAAVAFYVHSEKDDVPLAVEFRRMLLSMRLGKTVSQAIGEMAARVQIDAFSSFASAVSHSREVGSSISDTLKTQAKEMRRARFDIAERKAAKAAASMIFPIAVFIMPAMILVMAVPIVMHVFRSGLGDFFQ